MLWIPSSTQNSILQAIYDRFKVNFPSRYTKKKNSPFLLFSIGSYPPKFSWFNNFSVNFLGCILIFWAIVSPNPAWNFNCALENPFSIELCWAEPSCNWSSSCSFDPICKTKTQDFRLPIANCKDPPFLWLCCWYPSVLWFCSYVSQLNKPKEKSPFFPLFFRYGFS